MFHGGMMSSVNITREEAQQRSQVITAHSSKVLVDLSGRDPNGDPLGEPRNLRFLLNNSVLIDWWAEPSRPYC